MSHPTAALPTGARTPLPEGILASTLAALAAPRRLIPIVIVCAALVWAQVQFSVDRSAAGVGIALCIAFVLAAPYSWRFLAPTKARRFSALGRLAAYACTGAVVVWVLGVWVPDQIGVPRTFLTGPAALGVSMTLYWVGGWGLGPDIELEIELLNEQQRSARLASAARAAEAAALRQRLEPHFLFNTLNAIAEWCVGDPPVAERAVLSLAALVRQAFQSSRAELWQVEEELGACQALMNLYELRDPDALSGTIDAQGIPPCGIPPLTLLTLLENAYKHGPSAGFPGTVELRARSQGDSVVFEIGNPGPLGKPTPKSAGLALVRRRLDLTYGGQATLELERVERCVLTTLTIPIRRP